jgi:hypothetical protein
MFRGGEKTIKKTESNRIESNRFAMIITCGVSGLTEKMKRHKNTHTNEYTSRQ